MDFAINTPSLALFSVAVAFILLASAAEASIHFYDQETFKEVGNAYLLSGGSEGIVASRAGAFDDKNAGSGIHDGRSFIRFENITFWRSKEAADKHSSMAHSTGLIQATIFEAADRDNIGGSAYGGQRSICCTPDLAKLEGCKQGEVIRRPSAEDPHWPIVLNIQFSGNYLSTKMDATEAKRSSVKLDIYRKFSNALAVAVIASVVWIGYEVYFKATDPFSERWQSAWIITAFWDIIAFGLLCVICYLWPPSQSSQRYAYSEEVGDEFDDEEAQSLTRVAPEGDLSLVKQDKNVGNNGVFNVEDDTEEDKRE